VVVVGLGGFGSAALWRLAERGVDVAGIERHGIGHHLGSSHGATRLFRIACQEHPGLAAVALKSLELWTGLGQQTGQQLVRQSGCLTTGPPDSRPVRGAIAAAAAAGLPVVELSHEELAARQPQYAGLAPDDVAVWDPGAGICYPERKLSVAARSSRVRPFTTASRSTSSGTASHRDPERSLREVAILIAMSVSEQMPLADVKNRLSEVVDRLEREHGRVVITKHGHPAAVVISVDDLESLEETLDIMDSAALLADIRESLAELSATDAAVLSKEDALRLISGQ
jgi:prevent-host-death family protein